MLQLPVENRAALDSPGFAAIVEIVSQHRSIKHALDWMLEQTPPLELADMVTQDEYSHDFLIAYPGGRWLVYDST